jgi:hypothetical protein
VEIKKNKVPTQFGRDRTWEAMRAKSEGNSQIAATDHLLLLRISRNPTEERAINDTLICGTKPAGLEESKDIFLLPEIFGY